MKHQRLLKVSIILIFIASFSIVHPDLLGDQGTIAQDIYHHRNLGKAFFEENKIKEAIAELEQCVALAPDSAVEHVNLGIAYLAAKQYTDAEKAFDKAESLDATIPHIYYNRAILYKRHSQFEKSAEQFEKVKELDPACGDTRYNLGVAYLRLRQQEKAAAEFEECIQLFPDHISAHYHLYRHAIRTRQKEDADRELQIFLRLKETVPEIQQKDIALERSIYSEVVVPTPDVESPTTRKERTDASAIPVTFVDVSESSGLFDQGLMDQDNMNTSFVFPASQYTKAFVEEHIVQRLTGAAAFLDFDGDGYLDIYAVHGSTVKKNSTNRLYRNNGDGTFTDVAEKAGVAHTGMAFNCVVGDYNNDGHLDIYIANYGKNVLYLNNGNGSFTDVTDQAGVGHPGWSQDAIFVDYDHEGDLDIYVANYVDISKVPEIQGETMSFPENFVGSENVLYRNNGDGTFTDVTASVEVGGGVGKSVGVFLSDFDNDRDIDLGVANVDGQSHLYLNLRYGEFGEFSTKWCIQPDFQPLAAGDVNNDGLMDICGVARTGIASVAVNQDKTHFGDLHTLPGRDAGNVNESRSYFVDYNNDGRLDLLVVGGQYGLFRNNGPSGWGDVSAEVLADLDLSHYGRAAFGDYDNDGDVDLLLVGSQQRLTLLRNDGGNANHWVKLMAEGVKMNRGGIGSKVEVKAGAFYYKTEITTGHLLLGLGANKRLDTLRIKWPNGIAQNEIGPRVNEIITIKEKEGIPSSCPFVYVWDGEKYRFVKDILDVGALGVRMSADTYLAPDHDEVIKIDTVKLVPKDGVYSIRLTEELQELVYLDGVKLYVVDHPPDVSVYHNDKFTLPPFPEFVFHAMRNPIYPMAAYDHNQNDVLPLIIARDRKYPKDFKQLSYTGMTETHAITLDFGDLSGADTILLFLNSWINWGDSTTNVAVTQNSEVNPVPPHLQVKDGDGQWQTVIDAMGFPAGWRKTVAIDLTGKFLSTEYQVRIVTNSEIYWDEIFVGTEFHPESLTTTMLLPRSADLTFYGYSTPYSPDGQGPLLYNYESVQLTSPWDQHAGQLTRYGDVTELLLDADDKYVIMMHGDEVHLEFDAVSTPPLRKGWVRDYFFYADGWIKDGDLNTAFGDTVEPLPFHGMSGYPYTAEETYPSDSERLEYLKKYNTRKK